MINKYLMSRASNIKFVKDNLDEYIDNNLSLSRYELDDPDRDIARRNFIECYDYIFNSEDENDYKSLLKIHDILMKDLNNGIKSELSNQQIDDLNKLLNQPTKAKVEIVIDVMIFILDKKLFSDGDVRAALMFANKILVNAGNGFITIESHRKDVFRAKLKEYRASGSLELKTWIYNYCIKGIKSEYH